MHNNKTPESAISAVGTIKLYTEILTKTNRYRIAISNRSPSGLNRLQKANIIKPKIYPGPGIITVAFQNVPPLVFGLYPNFYQRNGPLSTTRNLRVIPPECNINYHSYGGVYSIYGFYMSRLRENNRLNHNPVSVSGFLSYSS